MLEREVRVSPDGQTVGIRSDWPEDHEMAWGCIHAKHGGHWSTTARLADWSVVTATELPVVPEPEQPEFAPDPAE